MIQELQKVESFVKTAMDEISHLQAEVALLRGQKQAQDHEYVESLEKTAQALYNSDFFSTKTEIEEFVKAAQADPQHVLTVLARVCAASDATGLGKVSSVLSGVSHDFADDPVARAAFGYKGSALIEED